MVYQTQLNLLKIKPVYIAGSALLIGCGLYSWNHRLESGFPLRSSAGNLFSPQGDANQGRESLDQGRSRTPDAIPARGGQGFFVADRVEKVTSTMPRESFDAMTKIGVAIKFSLPDGKQAIGVVERSEVDDEGRWVMTEGTLSAPAEGRFLFRRQPEGTPSGAYAGVIRFPAENYGYLFGESSEGEPELTFLPADRVSCVEYPMPPALIPEIVEGQEKEESLPSEHPKDVPIPGYQNGVIPLESLPGAVGVIYLDFDGEEGPHEGWGDFYAEPSGSNNTQIFDVWTRVAEDFSPYNVNVTTDLQVYLDAPETSRQRCIVTPTTNAAPGAGGVAYFNSWNSGGDTPCWAFYTSGKASAEVISHEIGHTLGLAHDGQNPDVGYYGGHGGGDVGWAPIMGVGYYQNLSQWSKGEYQGANEFQDDLAVMDSFNSVDFRADDHGDDTGSGSPLELFGTTVDDDGVIEDRSDLDVFTFTTTGGTVTLNVAPVAQGPNLDLSAEIRDASDGVVAFSNPDTGVNATFTNLNLEAGAYSIRVDGVGRGLALGDGYTDYASIGHYSINGSIGGAIAPDRFAVDEYPPAGTIVGTVTPNKDHGGNALTYGIASGNSGGAFSIDSATGTLTVSNPAQFNYDALSSGWNDPAEFELQIQVSDATQPALNELLRVIVSVNDTDAEAPVVLSHRYSFTVDASDGVGTADLTLVGGAAVTGGQLDLPGGATRTNHAAAAGTALAEVTGTIQGAVAISMEAWFDQDAAQNWAKLFMAGTPNGEDYLDITPRRGADGNLASSSLRNDNDTESHAVGGGPLAANTSYYIAAIWDGSSDQMTLYVGPVGGSLEMFTASMAGRSLADIAIDEFYLGSAVHWGDPDFDGHIDEFRIWNGALSSSKIAANFSAGANPGDDSDLDGLPDSWELSFGAITTLDQLNGNLAAGGGPGGGTGDFDGDGLSDFDEYRGGVGGTDPTDGDTDDDDFSDSLERQLGTDPNDPEDRPRAILQHRYSFDIDTADVVGSADLSLVGGAVVNGGELDLPGGAPRTNHAQALGASLSDLSATINSAYALSIEVWFSQDVAQDWAKVLMAGQPAGSNYLDITPRRGIDGNVASASINDGAGEATAVGSPGGVPISNETSYYSAVIWNPVTDTLTLKIGPVGGALSSFTAPMGGRTLEDLNLVEFRVGAAVQFGDPDFDGQIDELRVWRGALTDSEVAVNFAGGPGQPAGDLDGDGIPDEWEFSFNVVNDLSDLGPAGDYDHDGLSDLREYELGIDPTNEDTDGDGFSDGFEDSLGSDPDDFESRPQLPPTTLAHRYTFDSDTSDSVGNADLTLVGSATVSGGSLDLPGGGPRTNHAAALGTSLGEIESTVQGGFAVSMEGWFRLDTLQNWSKLFMAGKGSGGEYLDITPRRGAAGNPASISFNDGTTESTAIGGVTAGALVTATDYYCAAVWDPFEDQLTMSIGPVGGDLQVYTTSLLGRSLTSVAINEFYLGSAVQFPDQDLDGQIHEFRIWNGALSADEVQNHFALGPDVVEAPLEISSATMNAANDTLTLDVSGLISGSTYHLEAGSTLADFSPLAGSEFVAGSGVENVAVAVNPANVTRRFFRVVEGPIP